MHEMAEYRKSMLDASISKRRDTVSRCEAALERSSLGAFCSHFRLSLLVLFLKFVFIVRFSLTYLFRTILVDST